MITPSRMLKIMLLYPTEPQKNRDLRTQVTDVKVFNLYNFITVEELDTVGSQLINESIYGYNGYQCNANNLYVCHYLDTDPNGTIHRSKISFEDALLTAPEHVILDNRNNVVMMPDKNGSRKGYWLQSIRELTFNTIYAMIYQNVAKHHYMLSRGAAPDPFKYYNSSNSDNAVLYAFEDYLDAVTVSITSEIDNNTYEEPEIVIELKLIQHCLYVISYCDYRIWTHIENEEKQIEANNEYNHNIQHC